MDMNSVSVVGRLTRDPETRQAASGNTVANLRLAVNTRGRDQEGNWGDTPNFFDVVFFGATADLVERSLTRGSRIGVTGRLRWREWETSAGDKRQSVEIVGNDMFFLDAKGETPQRSDSDLPVAPAAKPAVDDDIPF